jgi:EmrB/QacA subfamily drug resistance transporter
MIASSPAPPTRIEPGSTGRWVLVSSILASGMVFIDGTALSIALPSMQAALQATGTDLLWITNAFSLPLAALLLLGGSLGDCFGRKRIFGLGIVVFAIGSLACGLAVGVPTLIGARVVQGIGGALMIPGALAMVSTFFGPAERGRAIGTWSAFSVLATAIGPVLGGILARAGLWRWVFFINLPFAVIALGVLFVQVPDAGRPVLAARIDAWGALTITLGLAGINYALIQGSKAGFENHRVLPALLLGALSLVMFVIIEHSLKQPVLPLEVFKSRALTAASLLSLVFYMALHGMLFFLPLNLIQVQGYDPALAGLTQLPLMALLIGLSRFAGALVDQHGPRRPLILGPLVAGFGFWWFSLPSVTAGPREFATAFLPGLLLVGAGLGLTAVPLSTTVMDSMSPEQLGLASGINSTLSRLAGVMAIAILGPVALFGFNRSLTAETAKLGLPTEAKVELARESVKLAEARPPANLAPETAVAVRAGIKLAFVDAFRLIARLTALLSWFGAVVAGCLLERAALVKPGVGVRAVVMPRAPDSKEVRL